MANLVTGRISIDDFILEMMKIPLEDLRLGQLEDMFSRLDLRERLIDEHIHFAPQTYTRNLVCRTLHFDMLVLCWEPDQVTTIHDHAGSLNVTRVHGGTMTSRLFEADRRSAPAKVFVRPASEERLGRNGLSCVDVDEIHQLANTSAERLVTVHVYARPLKDIVVYCPNSGDVTKVGLRYTLEDDFS